jgi:hypothetical protein
MAFLRANTSAELGTEKLPRQGNSGSSTLSQTWARLLEVLLLLGHILVEQPARLWVHHLVEPGAHGLQARNQLRLEALQLHYAFHGRCTGYL